MGHGALCSSYFGGGGGASPFPQPLFSLCICSWVGRGWVEGAASPAAPTPSQRFPSPSLIYGLWLEPLRMNPGQEVR